jgi:hypothetical protein
MYTSCEYAFSEILYKSIIFLSISWKLKGVRKYFLSYFPNHPPRVTFVGKKRNADKIFMGRYEGKGSFGGYRLGEKDNIKKELSRNMIGVWGLKNRDK